MRKSVELFSGFFPMSMPVVEKKIVKHSSSGRGSAVQIQRPAPFVVEIGYMAAVVIAVRSFRDGDNPSSAVQPDDTEDLLYCSGTGGAMSDDVFFFLRSFF